MTFSFSAINPRPELRPILISGSASLSFADSIFLFSEQQEQVYEVRYEYSCGPFRQAIQQDHILAVGHDDNFYLFDTHKQEPILTMKVEAYFGSIYVHENRFYVAGAYGIYCIKKNGTIIWQNMDIAVDGVNIMLITEDRIYIMAELNPPGGWKDFVLEN